MDLVALFAACSLTVCGGMQAAPIMSAGLLDPRPIAGTTPGRFAPWAAHVAEASRRFGVPERWVREVMRLESGGRTHLNGRPITSHAGAMGLMQVMPGTYAELRARYGFGPDPYDPRDNILAGTAYLREMFDRYGAAGAFAAYNAGPGRYEDYLRRGRPLPGETVRYVNAILPTLAGSGVEAPWPEHRVRATRAESRAEPATAPSLFVRVNAASERPAAVPVKRPNDSLFFTLSRTDQRVASAEKDAAVEAFDVQNP